VLHSMKNKLKAWLPKPETLQNNRWLRWMGPVLNHPRLWHFSRKGIALGLALGIFFGLLIPVAQIPFAATVAVILRANVPMAVASTLVTNPITFGPVYYGAYRLGSAILGEPPPDKPTAAALDAAQTEPAQPQGAGDRWRSWLEQLTTVGKPLMVGLAVVATASGLAMYGLVSTIWILRTRWTRRKRLQTRLAKPPHET
jgi:uncharacterized protein (DUF2062 family)